MTSAAKPRAAPVSADLVMIGVAVIMALAALAYLLSQRQQELRSSPAGFDGLQTWLAAGGGSAQVFSGGWMLDPGAIGLLVLPVYDTAPGSERPQPQNASELLYQQDENDLMWQPLREKLAKVPALIVLPKWRSGMRLTGVAIPALLVEEAPLNIFLRNLTGLDTVQITRDREAFTALPYRASSGEELSARLYAAQLFDGTACKPVIGTGRETLLAVCPIAGSDRTVLILSDPDLLNNHGLRLGQNAMIARDVLLSAAIKGSVVIDYSRDNWLADTTEAIRRERTWADLLRFFQPPFLVLWLGGGIMLMLVLWRSFRRAGPVPAQTQTGAGKMQAIKARARLMRLSGQDGTMLADYAAARIAATAVRLMGAGHARQIGEERAFLRHVARHRPDLSDRLAGALAAIHDLPPRIPPAAAIRHVEDLEQILELVVHDA
jgi:hypothetical protein